MQEETGAPPQPETPKLKSKPRTNRMILPSISAPEHNILKLLEESGIGFGTHHSTSPLNTIIPNEAELVTGGDGLDLESVNRAEEDTDQPLDNVEDTTKVNAPPSDEDTHNVRSHGVSSFFGGSHRRAFPGRNPGGDGIGSFLLLLNYSILCTFYHRLGSSLRLSSLQVAPYGAQIDILQRYEALNEDYEKQFESHRSCRGVSDRLTETQNQLLDTVRSRNQLFEDHKALQQVHMGCVGKEANLTEKLAAMEKARDDLLDKDREREERIKQLEADLASKTSSLIEAEVVVNTLKGDLKLLTVDLSQSEIVRCNYVRQLLPIVVQRLQSSGEYKKSLTDVFNLAIAARWSEGVKAACSEEEAEAFLATAVDYKDTFMS
nr:hypothetical protein [Tanacetum cinerariifolium]